MDGLISIVILFILGLLGVALAGLVAGFSPTLFIAQAAMTTRLRSKDAKQYTAVLIVGVLVAILVLLALFQTFNLNTLRNLIESAAHALFISVAFNVLIGLLFIIVGVFYVRSQDTNKAYSADTRAIKRAGSMSAIFGLGFVKTILSVSGATAVFIGGNLIGNSSQSLLEHVIYTAIFLIAASAPFLGMFYFIYKYPNRLEQYIDRIKSQLAVVNYRLTVGVGAIILGSGILIFNIMMALFY